MGHCWTGRIRPITAVELSRDRCHIDMLRHRLTCKFGKRHGQGKQILDTTTYSSQWYPEVRHFCPNTPVLLVGLKSDLRNNARAISILRTQGQAPITFQEVSQFKQTDHSNPQANAVAQSMGAQYIECSAKQNNGVNEVFQVAVELAVGNQYGKKKRTRNCSIL